MNIDSKWQNAEVPIGYINEIHLGICPIGWHIPTECEWNNLYDSLGSTPYAMQAKKNWHWNDATNVSGFSALSVGFRNNGFDRVGSNALFWSSAEFYCEGVYHGKGAYYWDLYANSAYYTFSSLAKAMGVSVRCFKNQERVCERNGS